MDNDDTKMDPMMDETNEEQKHEGDMGGEEMVDVDMTDDAVEDVAGEESETM